MKVLNLIQTENKICNKIITTFAALCCECKFLVHECERKYLPAILFFGEGGQSRFSSWISTESLFLVCADQDAKEQQQSYMAQFIALLQDLSCFVNRCNEVVMNIIQQLSALYTQPGVQNGRFVRRSVRHPHPLSPSRSQRLMDVSDLHIPVSWSAFDDSVLYSVRFRSSSIIWAICCDV